MSEQKKVADTSHYAKRHRMMIFLSSVLAVLFLSVSTILAREYYLEKITECRPGDAGICFELEGDGVQREANIKNLSENKKYRLVIKKITDGKSYEVGSVEINNTEAERKSKLITCTDSDGGENYTTKGKTVYLPNNSSLEDSCNGNELIEGVCAEDETGKMVAKELKIPCNGTCQDGVCKSAPALTCTDSDGGKDYYTYGVVSYNGAQQEDVCRPSDMVMEIYCENGSINRKEVSCMQSGCLNGACQKASRGVHCIALNGCGSGLECKPSDRYPGDPEDETKFQESYCCAPNECSTVIPQNGSTDHCIASGETGKTFGGDVITCNNGVYGPTE